MDRPDPADPQGYVDEYARRVNEGTADGDFSAAAAMRTEAAKLIWRAPDMAAIEGEMASAGQSFASGIEISFGEATRDGDQIRAPITGRGLPVGEVTGQATFTLDGDRIARLEVDLDHPIRT